MFSIKRESERIKNHFVLVYMQVPFNCKSCKTEYHVLVDSSKCTNNSILLMKVRKAIGTKLSCDKHPDCANICCFCTYIIPFYRYHYAEDVMTCFLQFLFHMTDSVLSDHILVYFPVRIQCILQCMFSVLQSVKDFFHSTQNDCTCIYSHALISRVKGSFL